MGEWKCKIIQTFKEKEALKRVEKECFSDAHQRMESSKWKCYIYMDGKLSFKKHQLILATEV